MATTAVEKKSDDGLITLYILGGGGAYDGYVLIDLHGSCKWVIQPSVTDTTTSIENEGNWCDADDAHIPNTTDDPVFMELENIRINGGVTVGTPLTATQKQQAFLAYWFEFGVYDGVKAANAMANTQAWNANLKKTCIAGALRAWGVPEATALTVATDFVDNGITPKYDQLGLTVVPNPGKSLLREMGKAAGAYFE